MAKHDGIIVGLDIGTTKICCIVGERKEGSIDIIGIGTHPSKGLRKGVVVNIDSTVHAIRKAVEEAELMAGCEITSVYAGIAGSHIQGFNSHGIVAVKDKEVGEADLARVIDAAKAVPMPLDREVLHVLPQEYIIDDQDGVREPLGMSGVRLEARVHIVTGSVTSAQNIVKCCNRTGLHVEDIVLEQLASSYAVLSEDEKELGVAIVDIGGGTTDIAILSDGAIVQTSVLSLGGNHLTNDIAVGLRTPMAEAERIKQKYGCAMTRLIGGDEVIEVPSVGGRQPRILSRQILGEIIEPRVEEIFSLVRREIQASGYAELLASGVVITGGTTTMEGMQELAEDVLGMPVRSGLPQDVGGLVDVVRSPKFSTAVGLVLYGATSQSEGLVRTSASDGRFKTVKSRMREWLGEIF